MLLERCFGGMAINPLLKYFSQDDFFGHRGFRCLAFRGPAEVGLGDRSLSRTGERQGRRHGKLHARRSRQRRPRVGGVAHGAAMARSPLSTERTISWPGTCSRTSAIALRMEVPQRKSASRTTAARPRLHLRRHFPSAHGSKRANRDTAWFSMIDREWRSSRPLSSTGFRPTISIAMGRQKQRLEDIRATLALGRSEGEHAREGEIAAVAAAIILLVVGIGFFALPSIM